MITLTDLKQTGPERFLARFDNGEELRTTLAVVTELSLYSGRTLTEDELSAVRDASARSRCRQRALRIIGARAMSVKELTDRLKEKGESPENAEDAAQWLLDMRLLDDAQYAAMCVRHYAAKGYGPGKIRNELYRRGIARELWDEALEQLPPPEETIRKFLRTKLRGRPLTPEDSRRLAAALQRRGFGWQDIRPALNELGQEIDET